MQDRDRVQTRTDWSYLTLLDRLMDEEVAKKMSQQLCRHSGSNAQMNSRQIKLFCGISEYTKSLPRSAITQPNMPATAYDRILRRSRTIADLAGNEQIHLSHVAEAISIGVKIGSSGVDTASRRLSSLPGSLKRQAQFESSRCPFLSIVLRTYCDCGSAYGERCWPSHRSMPLRKAASRKIGRCFRVVLHPSNRLRSGAIRIVNCCFKSLTCSVVPHNALLW